MSATLHNKSLPELVALARDLRVDNASNLRRQDLEFEIGRRQGDEPTEGGGVLEVLPDGFGFLRSSTFSYQAGHDDIYVSPSQIRRFNLRTSDLVEGQIRAPKEGEKYFALIRVEAVNGRSPDVEREKLMFANLTALEPNRPLVFGGTLGRAIDLVAPLTLGQRVALLASPRGGRGAALLALLAEIPADVQVVVAVVDERPEDLAPWSALARPGLELVATSTDDPPTRHALVADMALERAKRLAEQGRDVLFLVDSMSRVHRAFQAVAPVGGRLLHGAVDVAALQRAKRYFGAGRALAEGGSLSVIASFALDENPVDAALVDETRETANAFLYLMDGEGMGAEQSPGLDSTLSRSLPARAKR